MTVRYQDESRKKDKPRKDSDPDAVVDRHFPSLETNITMRSRCDVRVFFFCITSIARTGKKVIITRRIGTEHVQVQKRERRTKNERKRGTTTNRKDYTAWGGL